jgi:hypothetical protein
MLLTGWQGETGELQVIILFEKQDDLIKKGAAWPRPLIDCREL